jgi:hypothetical protein
MAKVLFVPNQRVRHYTVTYEKDTEYQIERDLAVYFVMNGWGSSPGITSPSLVPPPAVVEIQPDSVTHGVTSGEVK